ncbi:MAG: methyltransferase domain-containing protein [Pseudomonadota bacterium]
MFDNKKLANDFSKSALRYDENAILQANVQDKLFAKIKPFIAKNSKILDAGCGTGRLLRKNANCNIIQLDIAYNMCAFASKNGEKIINGNIASLPFSDESFDVVFSSLALQWLPDIEIALQELRRVLRKNGILAVSFFGKSTLQELKESFANFDNYQHVSDFSDININSNCETEIITEYYPDVYSIMRSLKVIGASNKLKNRQKNLMTTNKIKKINAYYNEKFAKNDLLPVTWEIIYLIEKK